jgi:predicted TIM-barrel fold metal-dependent hydrolase
MSPRLLHSIPFRFMRWRFGLSGEDEASERQLEERLVRTIDETATLDAAAILAFDAVYTPDGRRDDANTHLFVTNDYVIELARRHPKLLLGASVHPYRANAIDELEKCVAAGAVLMKWLPVVQGMNPADSRCFEFYNALVQHRLPLLCHTGGERSLPRVDDGLADPDLLLPALKRGVTVIMAHCGTRSTPFGKDFTAQFLRLAHQFEHCYGDTSALNLPARSYAWDLILKDPVVRRKLIHGSDWPIISIPSLRLIGCAQSLEALRDPNWMRRDVTIKQQLGLDADYWHRAATVLRVNRKLDQSRLVSSTSASDGSGAS